MSGAGKCFASLSLGFVGCCPLFRSAYTARRNSRIELLTCRKQKGDPYPSKELALVTLTRIYMLAQPYQTLVREISTPTIPAFVTACLQLTKTPSVAETVFDAFAALIPLYPTIFRPYSSQIRSAARRYLAPTLSDDALVPQFLQRASRKLVISLHCVAAKEGGSAEWAKLVDVLLKELHATADQVFRAVDESWEGTSGYGRNRVGFDGEPNGGSASSVDQLPPWTGLSAGAERLAGLFSYLSDFLRYPTKAQVIIPVGALLDAAARVCLIARLSPRSQTWDQAVETNAAIGRDEKEELWSTISDIHVAALRLISVMAQRLGGGMLPFVPEALDHLVRVFKSGMANTTVRMTGYKLLDSILVLAGPTMSKAAVTMLEPIIAACCRDLQEDAGFIKATPKAPPPSNSDSKKHGLANADLFLKPKASFPETVVRLDVEHKSAAQDLLPKLLSSLPQCHLQPTFRGLLDKTAILTHNREAMFSSVLNPYIDKRGRTYPSVLPHLSQQYPHDQSLEVLRTNLRTSSVPGNIDMLASVDQVELDDQEDLDGDSEAANNEASPPAAHEPASSTSLQDILKPTTHSELEAARTELPVQSNPFASKASPDSNPFAVGDTPARPDSPAKRKHEEHDATPSKRQEVESTSVPISVSTVEAEGSHDESDSDESVHLNMELDDDDDDEGEE